MNEIVKYHNDLTNQITIKTLNANELNFFMAICSKMRDKETEEIVFDFLQLKELVNWKSNDNIDFIKSLKSTNEKLIKLNFTFEDERYIVQFVLFPVFRVDKDKQTLTVQVNKEFSFLLNRLTKNFTRFELETFTNLNSKYSKYLYKELMKFKSTGCLKLSIEDFVNKLDIAKSYKMSHIDTKVLKPIERELSKVFSEFRIEKIKYKKRVTHIEFYFTPKSPAEQNIKNIQEAEVVKDKKIINQNIKISAIEQWVNNKQGLKYNNTFNGIIEYLQSIKYSEQGIVDYLDRNYNYVIEKYKSKPVDEINKIFITRLKNKEDVIDIEKEKKYLANKKKLDEEYQNLPPLSEELAKHMTTKIHQENILPKVNNVIDKKTEEYDVQSIKARVGSLPIEKRQILINELKILCQNKGLPEVMINDENMLININSEYVKNYLDALEKEKIDKNKKDDEDDIDPSGGLFDELDNTQGNLTESKNYKYDIEYIKEAMTTNSQFSLKRIQETQKLEIYKNVFINILYDPEKVNIFNKLYENKNYVMLIDYFSNEFIEVYNEHFGKGIINRIKNVERVNSEYRKDKIDKIKEKTFKTIDEAKEYINNNLDKFKNKLLSKNGKELKGGALNSKINKLAEELLATQ